MFEAALTAYLQENVIWALIVLDAAYGHEGSSIGYTIPCVQDFVKKFDEKFGKDGSKLVKMPLKDFNSTFNQLYDGMRVGLNKSTGAGLLKDYSPWLNTFQANNFSDSMEVPG